MKNTKKTGKHNFKTRIIAGALSLITAFSVGAVAVTSASAAEISSVTSVNYNGNTIYYSDDYFRHSSTEYDPHLATLSCIMTNFSVPLENPSSLDSDWYIKQPKRLYDFFGSIGFKDFETNDDYVSRSRFDSIGVACANKQVDDYTVIGVGIRSGGYFREWSNNVYLGDGTKSDYMHEGWYNAANKTIDYIDEYISANRITGKIKVWIAGFSRGGATTNLAAGLLDNRIKNNEELFSNDVTLTRDDLYAYTFEAPQGANYNSETVEKPGSELYNNIYNIVNPNDLVPKVAMSEYGFTRFGTDKFITTEFYDPENYADNRDVFLNLYEENGSSRSGYKADDFKMYGTPLKKMAPLVAELVACLPAGVADIVSQIKDGTILVKDDTKANYDANITAYLLLEEMTKNIGSRSDYCRKYQQGVSNFLLTLMNDVDALKKEELYGLLSKVLLSSAVSSVPGFGDLAEDAIRDILPADANTDEVIDAIEPLLEVVAQTYWNRPNELISFGLYVKDIFQNHDNGVNIAHLEAQDSYYVGNYNREHGILMPMVELRDSADFGRVTCKDYNDIGLYTNDGKTNLVSVKGAKGVKSEIKKCEKGFAVGYYSYATEEGLELFMPVNRKYILNMMSYSIKPKHTVSYSAFYQSVSPNSDCRFRDGRGNFSDWYFMNSDFLQRGVNMNYYK
ncbi:MAG: hypothetical protein VZQ83_07520 [Eubacterium sp.]|nr:hypothetical protein [Eubacterium sp.]